MIMFVVFTFLFLSSNKGRSSSYKIQILGLNQTKILLIILTLLIKLTIAGNGNSCKPQYQNGYGSQTQLYIDPSSNVIVPQFDSFQNCQSGGSCTYSATITPDNNQDTSFINFDPQTRNISWAISYSTAQVGEYKVYVTCNYCVSNGNSNSNSNSNCDTGTEKFTLTITNQCSNSTNITVTGPSGKSSNVLTSSGSDSKTFSSFKVNTLSGCQNSDIVYTLTQLPTSPSFMQYSSSNNSVYWSNPTVPAVYTYTISATVVSSSMNVTPAITTFVLNVTYACKDDINEDLVLTAPANDNRSYPAFAPSASRSYDTFNLSASLNNCAFSDVKFTKTIVPQTSGLSTSFISVGTTSGNYKTSWQSPTLSEIDVYTITIVASITNGKGTVTASYVFILTIYKPTCYASYQSFTLTKGSNNPTDKTYIIRDSQGSFTFNEFTETSDICTTSDIIYEATITPPSGQSYTFITISSDLKQFTWVTSSPSDAGVYTITLKGTIQTNQFGNKTASSSFKLTVYSCWYNSDTISISTSETIQPIQTLVNHPGGSYSVLAFTQQSVYCIDDEIAYSYKVTQLYFQNTNFITFNPITRLISWSSPPDADIYTIEVTGSIQNTVKNNFATTTLVLTVYSCATSIDTITITPVAITPVIQNVNTAGSSFVVNMYDLVSYACIQTDISYAATISADELQQTSFITFEHSTRTVSWTSPTEAGIYYVIVKGFIIQKSGQVATGSSTFQLTVYSCASSIDEMIITASVLSPVTQNSGTSGSSLVVPEFTLVSGSCFSTDIIYTATIKADLSQSTSFLTFSSSSMTILWTTPNYAGVYTVSVLGSVTNTFGLASATATFVLTVIQTATWVPPVVPVVASNTTNTTNSTVSKPQSKASNSTATASTISQTSKVSTIEYKIEIPQLTPEQIILPVPYWKQITVSNQGAVTITFSEKFIIPPHLDQMDSTILKVQLLPFGTTDIKYYKYTWNVTEFTNSRFVIQLNFTNPLYISSQGKNNYDKIQVTALEPIFFTSKTSFKSIPQDSTLKQDIPPQLSSNQAANKALGSVTNTLDSASKVASTGSFIANLAMSSSLSLLWGMINAIQIIAHLPYFNMMTPGNAQLFYEFMVNLANFKVLPLDSVYKWLGISKDDEQTNEQRLLLSVNSKNSTVDQAAAESANLFQNLGPIFLILYLAAFALILLIILIILQRVQRIKRLTQAILKKIKLMLFWNSTTRYLMESYLKQSLQSFLYLQVTDQDALFSQNNWKSTLYALFALTICFAAPILINIYLRHRIFQFRKKAFLDKFSSVILTFNWRYCSCANFISIFCYRRLVQVLLIVYFQDYPYAQVQLMTVSCIVVIILFGYSNVYFIPKNRRLEFFNEATILLCLYHFYLFTDFVPDAEARYTMGYSLIVATCFNFGVNVIVMIEATVQKFILMFKKLKQQYRIKKFKKRIQKQNQELLQQINQQSTIHNEQWLNKFEQKHIEMPYVLEEQQQEQLRIIVAQRQKDERALKRKMRRLEAQKEFEQTRLQQEMAQISEVDSEYEVDTKSPKTSKLNQLQSQDSIQIKQKGYQNIKRKITQTLNLQPQVGTGSYLKVSQLISEDLEQESKYKSSEQVQNEIYALNRMIESQLQELQDLDKKL